MREVIETGRTVEFAIESGCAKLGVSREEADFEILSLPKKGLLGVFGSSLAKVRVFVPGEEELEKKPEEAKQKAVQQPEKKPMPQKKPQPEKKAEKPAEKERVRPLPSEEEIEKKVSRAVAYLENVLANMQLPAAQVEVIRGQEGTTLKVTGEGLGAMIGRRGETLDSLQYLTGLAANRGDDSYYRITVDCENYREKRIGTLEALAKRMAEKVVRTGRSQHLEPMNPFERRVIHAAVSEVEGATSSSIGEEPNRHVVISSKNRTQGGRDRDRRSGSGRGRGSRPGGPRRTEPRRDTASSAEPATKRAEAPKEAEEFSLYSKIEL